MVKPTYMKASKLVWVQLELGLVAATRTGSASGLHSTPPPSETDAV